MQNLFFTLKVLTSKEEVLLSSPKDFKTFQRCLGLQIDSDNSISKELRKL